MKVVIADACAIISLIHIGRIDLIEKVFGDFYIANAVWMVLCKYDDPNFDSVQLQCLVEKVKDISSKNYLSLIMDFGESESVILYEELQADYLLIDDKKARLIAESIGVNCIGTLGLLIKAKQKGLLTELKPIFEKIVLDGRYFSKKLLNDILVKTGESAITK
jgi:predicted nucleic acid-binding protein